LSLGGGGAVNMGLNYFYQATSPTADTVNDVRFYNSSGLLLSHCTQNNATKGSGAWLTGLGNAARSLTDSNMGEAAGSFYNLASGKSGMAFVTIGDNQEYAWFSFTTAGVVTLINNSANVVTTSTDAKLVIRDAGTNVRIVNELGSTLNMSVLIIYNT